MLGLFKARLACDSPQSNLLIKSHDPLGSCASKSTRALDEWLRDSVLLWVCTETPSRDPELHQKPALLCVCRGPWVFVGATSTRLGAQSTEDGYPSSHQGVVLIAPMDGEVKEALALALRCGGARVAKYQA